MRQEVEIVAEDTNLKGILSIPKNSKAIVIFAHGSGSGRLSPRNQYVAGVLNKNNIATLLMDLLTRNEEAIDNVTAHLRFDIELLASRLICATDWLQKNKETKNLSLGYFGSSTGAAAALIAAAKKPDAKAIVSRGGRPDLAMQYLNKVKIPTLLIVGSNDEIVIELNKKAMKKLKNCKLEIIKGASHLFEEPKKLEIVARLAAEWFRKLLH